MASVRYVVTNVRKYEERTVDVLGSSTSVLCHPVF